MHHRQVPPIIRGSVQVGVGVNALGDERCRVLNVVGRCRLSNHAYRATANNGNLLVMMDPLKMDPFEGSVKLAMEGVSFVGKLLYIRTRIEEGPLPLALLLLECA